jgi:hypothetical protein
MNLRFALFALALTIDPVLGDYLTAYEDYEPQPMP